MPIEVSPAPFAKQQLPYMPKFIPPEIEGYSHAPTASIPRGPASAAESALIPPTPGDVAGPHRAIPALPDAGYTPPSHRAPSPAGGYSPSGPSGFPNYEGGYSPGSVYGGASVYENVGKHPHHDHYGGPNSSVYSENWGPVSLPAPRRAMTMSRAPPIAPSMPSGWPTPSQELENPFHTPHHHHQHHREHEVGYEREHEHHHQHQHKHSSRSHEVDDDAKSDGSYYARPKLHRHRSSPAAPTLEGYTPHRSSHLTHLRPPSLSPHREGSPLQSNHYNHSPLASSPLGRRDSSSARGKDASPLTPGISRRRTSPGDEEPQYRDDQKQKDLERDEHQGHHRGRKSSKPAPPLGGSLSDSESVRGRSASRRRPPLSVLPSEGARTEYRDADGNDDENGPYRRLNRLSLQGEPKEPGYSSLPGRPPHHRHKSHSHPMQHHQEASLPPATPPNVLPPPSLAPPSPYEQMKRRAHSFQGSNPGSYFPNPYHSPSLMGTAQAEEFDDGESVAGSAMTFMDGSVGGRVSQYGLPKYAHQPKVDYRR